nr:alpha/beta fold hydrolase [Streptomyces sp. ID38640]
MLTFGVLTVLLTWNTVSVRTETAEASGKHLVRLPGGDIHVVQDGPPGAPTVVLLHGLAGSTAWWDPVLPALRDLRVVRVDLLGHGGSAKPADGYGTRSTHAGSGPCSTGSGCAARPSSGIPPAAPSPRRWPSSAANW